MNPQAKIVLHTNLDKYDSSHFPDMNNFGVVPQVGQYIYVRSDLEDYFQEKKLPKGLEVVQVRYKEISPSGIWSQTRYEIHVELWYNDTEYKLYTESGHELL